MIRIATEKDIPVIHMLAHDTWWPAYEKILSEKQISFMLEKMYSEESLRNQMEEGNTFLIAERDGLPVAFAAFSGSEQQHPVFKLHKLYIHPEGQGTGTGRQLIAFVENEVREKGGTILELNVNRHNPALNFYKKLGFSVYEEVDIPYYDFFMNDYVMRKTL